ncbi:peptide deformylase [Thiohalorhabdus sp.]|uniref:peptide deformylase n=1 Tax=Thiohalorhabdus sp. TaxID=3094134 RepID=UPI002FC2AE16
MTVRTVLRMGDPRLLAPAEPVADLDTPELHKLVGDLWETMAANQGVGLAAPQIGIGLRVVVFAVSANPRYPQAEPIPPTALVNPNLHPLSEARAEDWEGCLSLPGLGGVVPRYPRLRYTGFTPEGEPLDREVTDFHARVVQHECDHIDGVLYPMRMPDLSRFGFTEELAEQRSQEL